ncbi:unnamed protein product [Haemonchus placei]|uniref:Uncharacterized protein n=1 Tax=Haemonchus placei TaxID=6290 RepID=A0A0N4WSW9_HAEPC|nr:unnamed protein product [Haemonchus placei]
MDTKRSHYRKEGSPQQLLCLSKSKGKILWVTRLPCAS